MVGADGEVGRRRPRLDLLVRAMGEAPVRETLDVSGEDWESILSGEMKLDETLLARLETMTGAMGQAVEWWDEVEDEEDEEDDGDGASEDIGGVERRRILVGLSLMRKVSVHRRRFRLRRCRAGAGIGGSIWRSVGRRCVRCTIWRW